MSPLVLVMFGGWGGKASELVYDMKAVKTD